MRTDRRHDRAVAGDALEHLAVRQVAFLDREAAGAVGGGVFGAVESKVGFACGGIGAVAREAVFGEDRADVRVVAQAWGVGRWTLGARSLSRWVVGSLGQSRSFRPYSSGQRDEAEAGESEGARAHI